jgi:hypothetical protein
MPPLYTLLGKCAVAFVLCMWAANYFWPLGLLGILLPFWMWRQYVSGHQTVRPAVKHD